MAGLHELVLELTDSCPLHCAHCSSESGPHRSSQLPDGVCLRLLNEAHALGASQVSFGGGEPALSPSFERMVARTLSLGMNAEVFTSGVLPCSDGISPWPDDLVGRLSNLKQLKVIFSIHGPDAATHDAITGVHGSFACMMQSLDLCSRAGLRVEMNFVPLRPNAASFCNVVRLAHRHHVGRISILRFVPQGRGQKNRQELELSAEEEDAFVVQVLSLRRTSPVAIRTGSPFNGIVPGNSVPCRAGSEKLVVQADGNVLPCEVFKHRDTRDWGLSVYGGSLEDILGSKQLRRLRSTIERTDCHACPVHSALRSHHRREAADGAEHVSQTAVPV